MRTFFRLLLHVAGQSGEPHHLLILAICYMRYMYKKLHYDTNKMLHMHIICSTLSIALDP